jgi:hypothetical protein
MYLFDLTPLRKHDLADPHAAATVWETVHAVATLQGIVNRDRPRLYLRYIQRGDRNIDDHWLAQLRQDPRWPANQSPRPVKTLEELITTFKKQIRGAVVYDPDLPAASNVASTLAGLDDLVAIRRNPAPDSPYSRLVTAGPRLPVRHHLNRTHFEDAFTTGRTAKLSVYRWAVDHLLAPGHCNPAFLAYYIDAAWIANAKAGPPTHHTLTNHDVFVARRAFFCDLNAWTDEPASDDPKQPPGADAALFTEILTRLQRQRTRGFTHVGGFTPWAFKYSNFPGAGGHHGGVATEWELVRVLSQHGAFLDADAIGYGAMANASFYAHFPLPDRPPATTQPTSQPAPPDRDTEWLMIYTGDYDAAAWFYQRIPDLWDDPARGTVPLTWAFSPILAVRAPQVWQHILKTRTAQDALVAADNGAGYLNPSALPPEQLPAWADHCATWYARCGLDTTGFLIDGRAPASDQRVLDAYARFSPNGLTLQSHHGPPFLHRDMPVMDRGPDVPVSLTDVAEAADRITGQLADRRAAGRRFHWIRTILRSATWHAQFIAALQQRNPNLQVVNAPVFYAQLRRALQKDAATASPPPASGR